MFLVSSLHLSPHVIVVFIHSIIARPLHHVTSSFCVIAFLHHTFNIFVSWPWHSHDLYRSSSTHGARLYITLHYITYYVLLKMAYTETSQSQLSVCTIIAVMSRFITWQVFNYMGYSDWHLSTAPNLYLSVYYAIIDDVNTLYILFFRPSVRRSSALIHKYAADLSRLV